MCVHTQKYSTLLPPIHISTLCMFSVCVCVCVRVRVCVCVCVCVCVWCSTVADTVIVTSKHNDDRQYIWESDATEFTIAEDPRGNTLLRGTTITLVMKEEAMEYLEPHTLRDLVQKYSQFINFPIYLWESKVG